MTIGDVLGVTGLLVALGICSWALMISAALLFPRRCQTAREAMEGNPVLTLLKGLGFTFLVGLVGIALLSSPAMPVKFVGWTIETAILAFGVVGAGGLAQLMGARLKALQPEMSEYSLVCRGAALVFITSLAPIIGWFLVGPVVFGMAVGGGIRALFGRQVASVSDLP